MFFKNNMRPSYAGAGAQNVKRSNKKNDSFMFDIADDSANFGGFDDGSERRSHTPPRKKSFFNGSIKLGKYEMDKKVFAIGIAAIAGILIIATILVACLAFKNPNITYKNNAYLIYSDDNGTYHLLANGELIEKDFVGEVTLIPSADNSFAYVYDNTDDGYLMYVIEGTKLKSVGGKKAEEIFTQATLEPGIIYKAQNGGYRVYSASGDKQILKGEGPENPDHFVISADASTAAYTIKDKASSDRKLYIYKDGRKEEARTKTSTIPVGVSPRGDYVYVTQENKTSLFILDIKKNGDIYELAGSSNFAYILETNIKGDQIIFCTEKDGTVYTRLCRYNPKKEDSVTDLGKNLVTSLKIDPSVVLYKDFADVYFTSKTTLPGVEFDDELEGEGTIYLNKKYEVVPINKSYAGKIDTDGKYFYYVKDGALLQIDLDDLNGKTNEIYDGVADFVITEKGDIYLITDVEDYREIIFHKVSTNSDDPISEEYTPSFSYYAYASRVYFTKDGEEFPNVYIANENKEADKAKFGTDYITSLPYFTETNGKKSYAIIYNEDKTAYDVYYTSNGNKFKKIKDVDNCKSILIGENELSDLIAE